LSSYTNIFDFVNCRALIAAGALGIVAPGREAEMSVYSNRAPRTREASEAYVRGVLELVGDRDAVEVLSATASLLEVALATMPPEHQGVPEAAGKWSVAQVLHHLADAELVWGYRLRRLLTEDAVRLDGYDQDVWAERFGYGGVEARDSLELFAALRGSNLRLLDRTTATDLQRTAVHAERGEATLETLLRLYAGHDLLHLQQIRRIQAAVAGTGEGV
jgi:uncharacterized damage-inducible protein DinB